MNLEIIEKQNDVTYDIPQVRFPAYEEYKAKAIAIADYISSMDVSTENVKETKATLAKARKLTDRLTRARIDMKKEILQNYLVFESQVKEIVDIVGDADKDLRAKVRELEEAEREAKKEIIISLWEERTSAYPIIEKVLPDAFQRWLSPKHLNKSTSMKSVEEDMTEYLRVVMAEIDTVMNMGEEYVTAYSRLGNLTAAIREVQEQAKAAEAISRICREEDDEEKEPSETFLVYGAKDIALAERLLTENNINFIKL